MADLTINGKDYVVPALSLRVLKNEGMALLKQTSELAKSSESDGYDTLELRGRLIYLALKARFDEVTEDAVMDALTTENTVRLWLKVLGVSGLDTTGQSGVGEQQPAAPAATPST